MSISNDTPIPASLASPHALTSYHTFHADLPPSNVPEGYNRFHPSLKPEGFPETRIVGLLACQRDPYLRELKGVEIVKAGKQVTAEKKDSRKKKSKGDAVKEEKVEPVPEGEIWEVELKDTVLFPEGEFVCYAKLYAGWTDLEYRFTGGGQPNDTGYFYIHPSSDSSGTVELKVVNVQRRGLSAVHHVLIPKDLREHAGEVLKEGVKVDMKVDWERRWDHVSHLISLHEV